MRLEHSRLQEGVVFQEGVMKKIAAAVVVPVTLFVWALAPSLARAQDPASDPKAAAEPSSADLAKKLANPISDLVSIPFQFNWNEGVGVNDDLQFLLNVQPVVPMSLTKDWNVIGRFIVPFLNQPPLVTGGPTSFGTGDIVFSTFFSPKQSKLIWGVGPVFSLPTTTNPYLGSGKWSMGPTVVVLKQHGQFMFGALVNQLWSFGSTGNTNRQNVNQMYLQPFLARITSAGVTYTVSSEMSANWEADSGEQWTIPIIAQVSKVTRLGPFPFSIGIGAGYYVEAPEQIGPKWKLRMQFVVMLPRGGKR
jgi:hypothetical protein